jgi:hypothetical protein
VAHSVDPRVDAYIEALPPWQRAVCPEVRELVHAADPEVAETVKFGGRPYFVLRGNVSAVQAAKDHVNVFLYDGAIVPDPEGIVTGGTGQHDCPHGGGPAGQARQRARAHRDVLTNYRQHPGRRLAQAQA